MAFEDLEQPQDESAPGNIYDQIIREEREQKRAALKRSLHVGSTIPSESAVQALDLSRKTGIPTRVVHQDPTKAKQLVDKPDEFEALKLLGDAPRTAKYLQDPYKASAFRHELGALRMLEQSIQQIEKPSFTPTPEEELRKLVEPSMALKAAVDFGQPIERNPYSGMADPMSVFAPQYKTVQEMREAYTKEAVKALQKQEAFQAGDTERVNWFERASMATYKGITHGIATNERGRLGIERMMQRATPDGKQQILALESELAKSPAGGNFATSFLYPSAKIVGQMFDAVDRSAERAAQGAVLGLGVAAMGGGGLATPVTAPVGFFGGLATGLKTGMAEQAYFTEAGNAYLDLEQVRGKNGEQLDEQTMYSAAAFVGGVNASLEFVNLGFITGPFRAAARKFFSEGVKDAMRIPSVRKAIAQAGVDYLKVGLSEAGTEGLQELTNVVAEDVAKMATAGDFETLSNSPEQRAEAIKRIAGVISESARGMALLGLPGAVTHMASNVKRANHTAKTLSDMERTIKASPVLSKNPELAREVIGIQTEGTTAAVVSMPFEVWQGFYAEKKDENGVAVDPRAIYKAVTGETAAYDEAKRTTGELPIATKDYLTSPILEEGRTLFQKHVRFNPMEQSQGETESLLSEQQKEAAEAKAAEMLSGERVQAIAKRVAKKEAQSQLDELKKTDIIAQIKQDFGRVYWLHESGKENAEELTTSGIPKDLIADMRRVDKEGRDYATSIDEVAAKYDIDTEGLINAIKQAQEGRAKAQERLESGIVPEHILGAVGEQEFQKALETNLSEAEADAKLSQAVETRKKRKEFLSSVQKVSDEIKAAVEAAGFKQEAAVVAKSVAAVFKTLGERENLDPYKLFSERPLTVTREGAAPIDEVGQVYAQPGKAGEDRGDIFLGKSRVKINLLKTADSSTFLHETGHLYLDLLERLATRPEASEQIRADWDTVRSWLELKEGEEVSRDQHEKWAEGFERYLMEGKAPSKALRGAFYRFKEWLSEIYQAVKEQLGADLSDDIRKVMDRLLATDAEIAAAQEEMGYQQLFEDAKKAGATDAQANKYIKLVQSAKEAAESNLLKKAMQQARQEREAWYEAEREKMRSGVEKEVNAEPIYRAVAALQKNERPDGTPLDTPAVKIDKRTLPADTPLKSMPRGITSDVGMDLDSVAGLFNFNTGKEFVTALQGMETKKDKIDRVTDERMLAQFGAEPTESEIKEAAMASIHNEDHVEQLLLEMQIVAGGLGKLAAGALPNMPVVRREALRAVNAQKLRDINPKFYLANERRAQKKAAEAYGKGDMPTFLAERRIQIVNHETYSAAQTLREEQEAFLDDVKKFYKSDEKLAKSRDMDVVNGIRAVLARVNIGSTDKSASEYLKSLKQYNEAAYESIVQMIEEAVPESVNAANREYLDLTAGEFRDLRKAIGALWALSAKSKQFVVDGKRMDMEEDVMNPLLARVDEIKPHEAKNASLTGWDRIKRGALFVDAVRKRVEHWCISMGGPFRKLISDKVHAATNAHNDYKAERLKEYEPALKALGPLDDTPIDAPEIGYRFNGGKAELLGAMRHTGNAEGGDSNLWKLLLGHSQNRKAWGTLDEMGNLDTSRWDKFIARMQREGILTKKDYDYLQAEWDLNERMKPDAQKAHYELNGFHFDEITNTPFRTPWGEYRGGYAPAIVDPNEVSDAERRDERFAATVGQGFTFPTTGSGSTMKRSDAYWRPLLMDIKAATRHIDWVSRYVNIEPAVADIRKLFMNTKFRERMEAFNPKVFNTLLTPWLSRTALQQVEAPMSPEWQRYTAPIAHWLKSIAAIKQLGLNFVNAAQNAEGLALGAIKTGEKNLVLAMKDYLRHPIDLHRKITEDSAFMRHYSQEVVGQLIDTSDEILNDPNILQKSSRWTRKHVFFFSKFTQAMVSDIVYLAAYNKAYAEFVGKMPDEEAHKSAVTEAESVVRTTQGSSAAEDVSAIEAGNAWARILTMYSSWFNMKSNLLQSETLKTVRESGLSNSKRRLFYLHAMGMMIPALIGTTIYVISKGGPKDPDDDGYLDDLLAAYFGAVARDHANLVPFAGQAAIQTVSAFDDNPVNDSIVVSPAIATLGEAIRAPGEIYHKVKEGRGRTSKVAADVMTLLTAITGMPIAAAERPVKYAIDVSEGYTQPTGPVDAVRGALTGR